MFGKFWGFSFGKFWGGYGSDGSETGEVVGTHATFTDLSRSAVFTDAQRSATFEDSQRSATITEG